MIPNRCAPISPGPAAFSAELSAKSFARCAEFITRELGIKMPPSKLSMVQSRLVRRANELHMGSVEQYIEYMFANLHTEERTHFINSITTNKTDFFRELPHFDYLSERILPSLSKARIWSAACSSGPEAYTLAMVLSTHSLKNPGFSFEILATDISTKVLEVARKGIYHESVVAPVSMYLRERYFLRGADRSQGLVRVAPELRETVSFHQLNLMNSDYQVRQIFDVIFLRNVLIYFDSETQQQVIQRLCRNLAPGGFLFTGLSEPLGSLDVPLTMVGPSIFRSASHRGRQ